MLKVNKCQLLVQGFAADDYDLSNMTPSGRSVKFHDDVLKSLVESDSRLSVQELSKNLGLLYVKSARYIDKEYKFHINYPRLTKIFDQQFALYCSPHCVQIHFYSGSSPETRNGSSVTT